MLRQLLDEQRHSLDHYFDRLDFDKVEQIVHLCSQVKGLILLTGMGKSGIIAEKIAMTLISTGTRALHLPTPNFFHGDLGIVSPDDLVLLFSKSGETEELLNLLPFLKKRGAKTIALVSNSFGRLALQADLSLCLPVEKELCPFDLAPTTSTEVQLLFGNLLAIALMKLKGFTLHAYGENHPSGTIGKKATLKVGELMITGEGMPLCYLGERLGDLLVTLSEKKCGCLVVIDREQNLQGIFTDGDLRRSLQSFGPIVLDKKIEEVMTRSALFTEREILAWDAMKCMQKDPKKWIMSLPVLEKNRVIGFIRMHDIIHNGVV